LIVQWDRAWRAGGDLVLGIWRDGAVVGGTGLHRRIGEAGLEIGYWVHVDHLRQGIATTASRAVTDLAFRVPEIEVVEIHHDVANRTSAGVPERLGYEFVGEIDSNREDVAPAETGRDGVWRVTREAWTSGS
jgi:RimJ/RimL family protein N-acetyltransferase